MDKTSEMSLRIRLHNLQGSAILSHVDSNRLLPHTQNFDQDETLVNSTWAVPKDEDAVERSAISSPHHSVVTYHPTNRCSMFTATCADLLCFVLGAGTLAIEGDERT
jgi:hypothetical protein